MDREDEREVEGRNGKVEQGAGHRRGQELPKLAEIPEALEVAAALSTGCEGGRERLRPEADLQPGPRPLQHDLPDHLEEAREGQRADREKREHQQRLDARGGEHPVIHGRHVQRHRQHQDVERQRERHGHQEGAPAGAQGLADLVAADLHLADLLVSRRIAGGVRGRPAPRGQRGRSAPDVGAAARRGAPPPCRR